MDAEPWRSKACHRYHRYPPITRKLDSLCRHARTAFLLIRRRHVRTDPHRLCSALLPDDADQIQRHVVHRHGAHQRYRRDHIGQSIRRRIRRVDQSDPCDKGKPGPEHGLVCLNYRKWPTPHYTSNYLYMLTTDTGNRRLYPRLLHPQRPSHTP